MGRREAFGPFAMHVVLYARQSAMTTARDAQSLRKSAKALLLPMVRDMGFAWDDRMFVRSHQSWKACFSLQPSSYGNPHFWVNVGLNLPALGEFYGAVPRGLLLGWRLAKGRAYRADDSTQVEESFRQLIQDLVEAESWFMRMDSFSAIADECCRVNKLSHPEKVARLSVLSAREYGFLLTLAGRHVEAEAWLSAAQRVLMDQPDMKGMPALQRSEMLESIARALRKAAA